MDFFIFSTIGLLAALLFLYSAYVRSQAKNRVLEARNKILLEERRKG